MNQPKPRLLECDYTGLRKVISGGQDGVDRGALAAAKAWPLSTGGWAPLGYRTASGDDPTLKEYGLLEHGSPYYPPRTKLNVRDSDGTLLIYTVGTSAGTVLTRNLCLTFKKPCYEMDLSGEWDEGLVTRCADWVVRHEIETLNVAGNHKNPNYHFTVTHDIVIRLLTELDLAGMVQELV